MDHREQIMREAFDKLQVSKKGVAGMTESQRNAVKQAIAAITEALEYSTETYEVRLSDLDRLQRALFKLEGHFATEPSAYQAEAFAQYGFEVDK